ncbi:hypothetical protein B0I37DRAFT_154803 [Chaetomium sp. MPI-CAGE-AT-0009]|nr:hypothetical protein B0I37DRAFT_154803 [Chaetomium sp. MPI-CAGE-AT-0009]
MLGSRGAAKPTSFGRREGRRTISDYVPPSGKHDIPKRKVLRGHRHPDLSWLDICCSHHLVSSIHNPTQGQVVSTPAIQARQSAAQTAWQTREEKGGPEPSKTNIPPSPRRASRRVDRPSNESGPCFMFHRPREPEQRRGVSDLAKPHISCSTRGRRAIVAGGGIGSDAATCDGAVLAASWIMSVACTVHVGWCLSLDDGGCVRPWKGDQGSRRERMGWTLSWKLRQRGLGIHFNGRMDCRGG